MTPIQLRLKELRTARGWSQQELADRAGVQRLTVMRLENGQSKGVDFATLEGLAKALEVDAGYLIVTTKR